MKYRIVIVFMLLLLPFGHINAQDRGRVSVNMELTDTLPPADTFPHIIPILLPTDLFIPKSRLFGLEPWTSAPLPRPVVHYLPLYGFSGSIGFGTYSLQHPEKFFSTLEGANMINIPALFLSQQMMLGNTFKLGKAVYLLSGIMYGAQLGVMGNNWGMGTREGIIIHPSSVTSITFWTQYFQSVSVYSPVMYPPAGYSGGAAIVMPATPEVFTFGVQASFVVGEFIIGIGTSIAPVPYQDRDHSEFRIR